MRRRGGMMYKMREGRVDVDEREVRCNIRLLYSKIEDEEE